MFDNPLIERYRYSQLRPRQFWIYLIIYTVVISLMLLINFSIYYNSSYSYRHTLKTFFEGLYFQFLMLQTLIMWIWGAFNSGSALNEEITQKSYDFFRMVPLSAHDKVTGIVLGKNLVTLLFAGINCFFLLIFGRLGSINLLLQTQIGILLISGAILASMITLLSSTTQGKKRHHATGPVIIVLAGMFLFPLLLSGLAALAHLPSLELTCIKFFSINIPVLGVISLLTLYFSAWIHQGCLRQLTLEKEPLFTPGGAVLFIAGYILIIIGFFFHHLLTRTDYIDADFIRLGYGLWATAFFPLVFIPLGALKSFDKYLEEAGNIQQGNGDDENKGFSMLRSSNLRLWLNLFLVWLLVAVGVANIVGIGLGETLHNILILFSFYLFFGLLLELCVVCSPVYSKMHILAGFIMLVQIILPTILAATSTAENIHLFSPIGFYTELVSGNTGKWQSTENAVLAVNLLWSAILLRIISKRYLFITESRLGM